MDKDIIETLEKFPFLTYGSMLDKTYIGIVQNCDIQLISVYILNLIPTEQLKKDFLECGFEWWWGSNRQIPINIFLKDRFKPFREYLKHFSRKDFLVEYGPTSVSLAETIAKRVRKRQITLVKDI